jgi:DNA-3-methyladenine glycosylase
MRLTCDFFRRDALTVAPELAGKLLVRRLDDGPRALRITETEAYLGEADTACHAHKGRTRRTETLYLPGGAIYVYLCYGLHWLINIVTGQAEDPQCVLIRACEAPYDGPAKLTKRLMIDRRFNGGDICLSDALWIEDDGARFPLTALPRVGIGYASPEDQARLWRFAVRP